MTLLELCSRMDSLGVRLSIRLAVDAPRGVLTPELVDALTEHKALLLTRLAREAQWVALSTQRWGPALTDGWHPGITVEGQPDLIPSDVETTGI
jgi:hypothetical protein